MGLTVDSVSSASNSVKVISILGFVASLLTLNKAKSSEVQMHYKQVPISLVEILVPLQWVLEKAM